LFFWACRFHKLYVKDCFWWCGRDRHGKSVWWEDSKGWKWCPNKEADPCFPVLMKKGRRGEFRKNEWHMRYVFIIENGMGRWVMHEILFLIVVSACYGSYTSGNDIMDTKLDVGFESYVTHTYMRQYLICHHFKFKPGNYSPN